MAFQCFRIGRDGDLDFSSSKSILQKRRAVKRQDREAPCHPKSTYLVRELVDLRRRAAGQIQVGEVCSKQHVCVDRQREV
jgi:hypothetical protein